MVSAVTAVTVSGTSRSDSSRLRAVTTTSSRITTSSDATVCAWAVVAGPTRAAKDRTAADSAAARTPLRVRAMGFFTDVPPGRASLARGASCEMGRGF